MVPIVTVADISAYRPDIDPAKAQALIDDAIALAGLVAPCITEDGFEKEAAAKAILRGAILRRADAGSGAVQSQTRGPFQLTMDTRTPWRGFFTEADERQLRALCPAGGNGGARTVDTAPRRTVAHPLAGAWVNGPTGYAPGEVVL